MFATLVGGSVGNRGRPGGTAHLLSGLIDSTKGSSELEEPEQASRRVISVQERK